MEYHFLRNQATPLKVTDISLSPSELRWPGEGRVVYGRALEPRSSFGIAPSIPVRTQKTLIDFILRWNINCSFCSLIRAILPLCWIPRRWHKARQDPQRALWVKKERGTGQELIGPSWTGPSCHMVTEAEPLVPWALNYKPSEGRDTFHSPDI